MSYFNLTELKNILVILSPWIINLAYGLSILPQIYLNYKHKSTQGLSDFFIMGYFDGYLAYFIYAYYFNFPLAYKFLLPFTIFISFILIYQRFFYHDGHPIKSRAFFYYLNFLLILLILPSLYFSPIKAANIAGWISTVIWFLYLFPQALNIYLRKTTKGFSFWLVLFIGLGGICDLSIAMAYNLPIQIYITGVRGIFFFFIFAYQFWLYKNYKR